MCICCCSGSSKVSPYNDIFGFYIWPAAGGTHTNVALLPNSTHPVSINTVNPRNSTYYVSNFQKTSPYGPSPHNTIYNGLTRLLKTADYQVTSGTTYRVLLAIADGGDMEFDSVVWIKYGSIKFNVSNCEGGWVSTNCSGQCGGGSGWLEEVFVVRKPAWNGGVDCQAANGTTRNNVTACTNSKACPPVNCTGSWNPTGSCTGKGLRVAQRCMPGGVVAG